MQPLPASSPGPVTPVSQHVLWTLLLALSKAASPVPASARVSPWQLDPCLAPGFAGVGAAEGLRAPAARPAWVQGGRNGFPLASP